MASAIRLLQHTIGVARRLISNGVEFADLAVRFNTALPVNGLILVSTVARVVCKNLRCKAQRSEKGFSDQELLKCFVINHTASKRI